MTLSRTFSSHPLVSPLSLLLPLSFVSRHVILPKPLLKQIPKEYFDPDEPGVLRILKDSEWRGIGITQSLGWEHYEVHGESLFLPWNWYSGRNGPDGATDCGLCQLKNSKGEGGIKREECLQIDRPWIFFRDRRDLECKMIKFRFRCSEKRWYFLSSTLELVFQKLKTKTGRMVFYLFLIWRMIAFRESEESLGAKGDQKVLEVLFSKAYDSSRWLGDGEKIDEKSWEREVKKGGSLVFDQTSFWPQVVSSPSLPEFFPFLKTYCMGSEYASFCYNWIGGEAEKWIPRFQSWQRLFKSFVESLALLSRVPMDFFAFWKELKAILMMLTLVYHPLFLTLNLSEFSPRTSYPTLSSRERLSR